jgi:hypothetical protein
MKPTTTEITIAVIVALILAVAIWQKDAIKGMFKKKGDPSVLTPPTDPNSGSNVIRPSILPCIHIDSKFFAFSVEMIKAQRLGKAEGEANLPVGEAVDKLKKLFLDSISPLTNDGSKDYKWLGYQPLGSFYEHRSGTRVITMLVRKGELADALKTALEEKNVVYAQLCLVSI